MQDLSQTCVKSLSAIFSSQTNFRFYSPKKLFENLRETLEKLLKNAKMDIKDIDLIEINEAFASVVLRYQQAFDLDPATVNVNGGAIAMGHPLGATGAMILGTVLDELERRDLNTALVTLCIGAGMADLSPTASLPVGAPKSCIITGPSLLLPVASSSWKYAPLW